MNLEFYTNELPCFARTELARREHLDFRLEMCLPTENKHGLIEGGQTHFSLHQKSFKKCLAEIKSDGLDFEANLRRLNPIRDNSVSPGQQVLDCFPGVKEETKEVVRDYLDKVCEETSNVEINPDNLKLLTSRLSESFSNDLIPEEVNNTARTLKLQHEGLSPTEIVRAMPEEFNNSYWNNIEATENSMNALTFLEHQPSEFVSFLCFQPKIILLIGLTQFLNWYHVFSIPNVFTEVVKKIHYIVHRKMITLRKAAQLKMYRSLKLLIDTASVGAIFYSLFQPSVDSWLSKLFTSIKNSFSGGQIRSSGSDILINTNQNINRNSGIKDINIINSTKNEDLKLREITNHSRTFELTGCSGLKELSKDENYLSIDIDTRNSTSDSLVDFKKIYESPQPSKEINRVFYKLGRGVAGVADDWLIRPVGSFFKGCASEILERRLGKPNVELPPVVVNVSVSGVTTDTDIVTNKPRELIFGRSKLVVLGGIAGAANLTYSYLYPKILALSVSEKADNPSKSLVERDENKLKKYKNLWY